MAVAGEGRSPLGERSPEKMLMGGTPYADAGALCPLDEDCAWLEAQPARRRQTSGCVGVCGCECACQPRALGYLGS
eukprot:4266110-Pleurochrysis_carterae.AAC.1